MAYTSLHEMHNSGMAADRLNVARAALNSIARWAPQIVNPVDINGMGMVYRFDIRDYWGYNKGVRSLIFGGLNQRRTDAFMFIIVDPRRQHAVANNGGNPHRDLRLNLAASCMGCHEDGMERENNDLRDWLESGSLNASWRSDPNIVERMRQLYPTTQETREIIENDHTAFYEAMLQIREGMILGEDKNLYVEPIVNTFEWAQIYYGYPSTLAN
jgi:hypothetical protein